MNLAAKRNPSGQGKSKETSWAIQNSLTAALVWLYTGLCTMSSDSKWWLCSLFEPRLSLM